MDMVFTKPWVQKELAIAMDEEIDGRRVKVLPILIEKLEKNKIPASIRDKLYANFTTSENFDKPFSRLLKSIDISNKFSKEKLKRLNNALLDAAKKGQTVIIRVLLDRGAEINTKNKNGETSLMLAAKEGHTKTIHSLLAAFAEINAKDNNSGTALIKAAVYGHVDIVEVLLKSGADMNMKTKNGWTSLMLAARNGHPKIVQVLQDKGADVEASGGLTEVNKLLDLWNDRSF